jgi:hypothetical protein
MPYADVNGQRLFFADAGCGEDVSVFSHGFFMSQAMFDAQVAALPDRWRCTPGTSVVTARRRLR